MTAAIVFLALWSIMALSGDMPIGRTLHRIMVEAPATALNRVTRKQVMLTIVLVGLGSVAAWYGANDGVRMFSMAVPDAVTWFATFEVSAYLDVIAAALAATSAIVRLRTARRVVIAFLLPSTRKAAGDARPRSRRHHAVTTPANDDEDRARFALAS